MNFGVINMHLLLSRSREKDINIEVNCTYGNWELLNNEDK